MTEKADPKDKTILVVDDDESICLFLRALLEKEGFKIEVCYDGNSAVKKVEAVKIDLVILDWMMPVLTGFEVLKMLQTDEHRSIPVIVITARVADRNTIAMIKQEMNVVDFVAKPIQHAVFVNRVHQVLDTMPMQEKAVKERFGNQPYH